MNRGMSPPAEAVRSTLASLQDQEKIHTRFEFLARARSTKDRHRRLLADVRCEQRSRSRFDPIGTGSPRPELSDAIKAGIMALVKTSQLAR